VKEEPTTEMNPIKHLILFIHPPVTYSYHKLLEPAPEIAANCRDLMASKTDDAGAAVCIVQSAKGDKPLVEVAQERFGDRCVVDPRDNSVETLAMLAQDADRAFGGRGNHGEWNIYELWSSNNARRWVEGLKDDLGKRGYSIEAEDLTVETFGSWSGCHHKYSNFMTTYLDARKPATVHAEADLCTLKGMPMEVGQFVECVPLGRHVLLFLFLRTDGCPMAQFWDGLRPVWERPHTAKVVLDPADVDLFNFSPNSLIPVDGVARKTRDGFIADVGDGCHPAFTTIVGHGRSDTAIDAFRSAMCNAVIAQREGHSGVMCAVEV